MVLPRIGFSPAKLFVAGNKPSLSKDKLRLSLLLTLILAGGMGPAGFIFGGEQTFLRLAMKVAMAVALLTTLLGAFSPVVEWYADRLPLKTIGHVGAILFIIGFFLQAIPNVVVLLDLNDGQFLPQATAPSAGPKTIVTPQYSEQQKLIR
jgi:hypothetical protein